MDPEFARQYYESAAVDHWWFSGRQKLVSDLVGRFAPDGTSAVDLGAGAESLLPESLETVKLDLVRPDVLPDRFVQASAEQLPFRSGSFDVAGLFDILEHLREPERCLVEARRVLKPAGSVIVTVPAHQRLWSPHDDLVGHERRYSRDQLVTDIEGAGLTVRWVSGFYGFLLGPAAVRTALRTTSPMSMPPLRLNRLLTSLAATSAARAFSRPSRVGLSLAAVATPV